MAIKLGEIFLLDNEWKLSLACTICDKEILHLESFLIHCLEHYFSLRNGTIDMLISKLNTECLLSEKESETVSISDSETFEEVSINMLQSIDESKEFICENENNAINTTENVPAYNDQELYEANERFEIEILPVNVYSCCGKSFKSKQQYSNHKRYYHTASCTCEYCGQTFGDTRNFTVHRNRHLGIKPYSCDYCHKKFTTSTEKTIHHRFHTKEKPYKCKYCPMLFVTSSKLAIHHRQHNNERIYNCETCGKSYADKNSLDEHKNTHTGNRPFPCKYCPLKFSRRNSCRQHIKMHERAKLKE